MIEKIGILVADDEQVIRDLLADHLTSEGFDVVTVPSGEEALEMFREDQDRLVITDIRMEGMSGVQLLEEVKKVDENAVVVMITSHASLDTAVATLRAGAYDYLFKPFEDLDKITEVVKRAMEKIELTRENRKLLEDLEQSNIRMEQSNEMLRELAIRDGLTGLFNHRHFKEVLAGEITRAERYKRPLCMVMIDVDNFKQYNDSHGHPAGDEVLKGLARIISTRLRDVDICARYGGEEFAILLPETELESGTTVAENIRAAIETSTFSGGGSQATGEITVSLGVAQFTADGSDVDSLIRKADQALYEAKREGRNRVKCSVDPE